MQGLMVEGDIERRHKMRQSHWSAKIGQGHRVKLFAESIHLGEALCEVWWL